MLHSSEFVCVCTLNTFHTSVRSACQHSSWSWIHPLCLICCFRTLAHFTAEMLQRVRHFTHTGRVQIHVYVFVCVCVCDNDNFIIVSSYLMAPLLHWLIDLSCKCVKLLKKSTNKNETKCRHTLVWISYFKQTSVFIRFICFKINK